ncbi:hypothetical protein, partial [Alkalilimnicola sp. S0819]|uniref:hypothetical protein n=1 Tax=Alkalilimnicola sp. S0819 TaxID=2613922 RepID=UPI001D0144A8
APGAPLRFSPEGGEQQTRYAQTSCSLIPFRLRCSAASTAATGRTRPRTRAQLAGPAIITIERSVGFPANPR